ncbi:MAG: Rne/Rng family ribonuclease [Pedosphaera sp.]|nr:Rne/Rng family ribonuclease [Pedosphaera sp.]
MQAKLLKKNDPEAGREDMENGRILDEPVYDKTHESEILRAENKAAGIKEEPKESASDGAEISPKPRKKKEESGVVSSVKKFIRKLLPKKPSGTEIIINAESLETRIGIMKNNRLEDFTIERNNVERIVASIYKGKVRNLENRLEAAFVDIGIEKNAFLHYWDILPANLEKQYEVVERKGKRRSIPRISKKDIPKKYPTGSEIILQIQKGPIGTKGPRATTHLSIPGRFLVLLPYSDQLGISKKIQDSKERRRLKSILQSLDIPDNMGAILRTAGEGQRKAYFVRDLTLLMDQWKVVKERIDNKPAPTCVYREPDLIERTVRDFLTDDVDRILIDNHAAYERMQLLIEKVSPRSKKKVQFYSEAQPIFDRHGITKQLEQAFSRKVTLKSGGALVIDETEALVAIDVNSGSHKGGGKDQSSTILRVNVEAAEEVCRQLKLRNMGGLVVIDYIDMKQRRDREKVFNKMRECLRHDKAKTHIEPISKLGLMEMTRQRQSESVQSAFHDECDYCKGRGVIKSPVTMSVEIQRKLTEILKSRQVDQGDSLLRIVVNPNVLDRLCKDDEDLIINFEKKYLVKLEFRSETAFHAEQFKIVDGNNNSELISVGEQS